MCDMMVALGSSTRDGRVLIAKNSDRHPNEPHIVIWQPRQEHPAGRKVRCTYVEVDQARSTHEVVLFKPAWIWGCEMGANEFGLNMGNEAVFTRVAVAPVGLTGMDMMRLALERCRTSEEAVDYLVELLARYGQGGNCGYGRRFLYHNAFLIADPASAWLLETAGEYWAAARIRDFKTLSNCLTLGEEYDRTHPELINYAVRKGWCHNRQKFHFAKAYTNPLITGFSGAKERMACSQEILHKQQGMIDVEVLMRALRAHHAEDKAGSFAGPSVRSVCMHGGGLIGDHTTGSYVASLGPDVCTYWITGSSTPCLSVFKPLWVDLAGQMLNREEDAAAALEFWYEREELHRAFIDGRFSQLSTYLQRREHLEQDWLQEAYGLAPGVDGLSAREKFMKRAWQEEGQFIAETKRQAAAGRPAGGLLYRSYWQRQTKKMALERLHPRIFD
jgi:hypothetical protein